MTIRTADQDNPTVLSVRSTGHEAVFSPLNINVHEYNPIPFEYNDRGLLVVSGGGCLLSAVTPEPQVLSYQSDPRQCSKTQLGVDVVEGFHYNAGILSTTKQKFLGKKRERGYFYRAALFSDVNTDRFYVEP